MNLFFLALTLLFSCTEKAENIDNNPFLGKWHLMKVTGGFSPIETFQAEEIIWWFKSNDSLEIKVNFKVANNSLLSIKNDTTLLYSYNTTNLLVGRLEYEYRFEETILKLFDNLASDGKMFELEKK